MQVALCFPPDTVVPTAPFGSLPLLQACLKNAGHACLPLDLAIETFEWLSHPDRLARFYTFAEQVQDPAQRSNVERLLAIPQENVLGAHAAMDELRKRETYFDPERMHRAFEKVGAAGEILSLVRQPLDPRNSNFNKDLFAYLAIEDLDIWDEAYDALLRDRLTEFGVGFVGITIPFSTQIAGAMRLARWIRRNFPGVKIIAGGTGIVDAEEAMLNDARTYDFFDYVCMGDGEEAIVELVNDLEAGGDGNTIDGLFRRRGDTVLPALSRRAADMEASPTPDFDGIPFDKYLSPERTAIVVTSRGCYYGKCTFCPESFRLGFRRRSSVKVWEDVRHIAVEQGIDHFMFWDPLSPPGMLTEVSRRSKEEGVKIHWMAEVKFERMYDDPEYVRTLAEGGGRYLQFGFESGVQRVLDGMDKGNDLEEIDRILDTLGNAGINVGVFFFIGFPTEFEEDARETWRFLVRNRERIAFAGYVGTFGLGRDIPVYKDPERFGIDIYYDDRGNPQYKRRDGAEWDFDPLHRTYFHRSDQPWIENGVALQYSSHSPEEARRVGSRLALGPPSFIRPLVDDEVVFVAPRNGVREVTGTDGGWAYIARSTTFQKLSSEQLAIVNLARKSAKGVTVGALCQGLSGEQREERLRETAWLLDLGVLDREPMQPGECITGEDIVRAPVRRVASRTAG